MELTRRGLLHTVLAASAGLGLAFAGRAAEPVLAMADEGETRIFTDSCGREVEVPAHITAVAPSGALAQMVLLTYDPSVLCGLASSPNEGEEHYFGIKGDDYLVFGHIYGGKGDFNKEMVAAAGTQIVIDIGEAKKTIVEDLDQLQNDIGIPCVHIESSMDSYADAYTMLGDLLGNTERAAELAAYCSAAYADTQAIVETIPDDERALVAFLIDETHAIAATSYQGQVVDNAATNVVVIDDVTGSGLGNEISLEQLALWDPQMLFIADEDLYDAVADDPAWSTLTAVANGDYYLVPSVPYGWLNSPPGVNQLLGAQWFPRVCYPELFDDDMRDIICNFYKTMYGYELSDDEYAELTAKSVPAA